MDIFWLYLFVKLDEIRSFLMSDTVTLLVISVLIVVAIWMISSWTIPDNDGDHYPFSGFLSTDHLNKLPLQRVVKLSKRFLIGMTIFVLISYTVGTFLPSVKQAAFIYIVYITSHSETLQNVPEDLALIISRAAHKYAKEQK